MEGHALLVAPRKGLGRFRPPPRLRFPVRTRHLSFETVYSRNGTSKRDQRRRGGQHSKETEYYYRSSSRTASNSPLLPCWLVVSVEWRSYRLPWKESRARTPFSRPTTYHYYYYYFSRFLFTLDSSVLPSLFHPPILRVRV